MRLLCVLTVARAVLLPDPSPSRVSDPDGYLANAALIDDRLAALHERQVAWPARSPCAGAGIDA